MFQTLLFAPSGPHYTLFLPAPYARKRTLCTLLKGLPTLWFPCSSQQRSPTKSPGGRRRMREDLFPNFLPVKSAWAY